MPQLDMLAYNNIHFGLYCLFWIYFIILYIAVSYTMHRITTGIYFKFILIASATVIVLSVKDLGDSTAVSNSSVVAEKTLEKNDESNI